MNHVCLCLSGVRVSLIKLCVNRVCLSLSGVGVSLIKLCESCMFMFVRSGSIVN